MARTHALLALGSVGVVATGTVGQARSIEVEVRQQTQLAIVAPIGTLRTARLAGHACEVAGLLVVAIWAVRHTTIVKVVVVGTGCAVCGG